MECQQNIPFGLKILRFSIPSGLCMSLLKHAVTYPYFFKNSLHVAILAVRGSATPVQRCLDPTELPSDDSDAFPGEAVAQFLPGFSLFVDEPINCHLNPQSANHTLSKHQAISPSLK